MADTALDTLKRMTAWDSVPTLSNDDLQSLLDRFAREDSEGVAPGEDDWIPTYDFRAAARQGWKLKMGKAADLTSTDLDGNRMSQQQVFDHCERMIRQYSGTASPVMTNVPADTTCTF